MRKSPASSLLRRATQRLLPPLLALLLLAVVSGGFPPANWQLLAHLMIHPASDLAAGGSSVQAALVILWVQSVLLAIAWIGLIILSVRGLIAVLNGTDQTTTVAPPALPLLPPPRETLVSASAVAGGPSQPRKNMFDEFRRLRHGSSGTITVGKNLAAKRKTQELQRKSSPLAPPENLASSLPTPASSQSTRPLASLPDASGTTAASSPQAASRQRKHGDPFAVQTDVLELFERPDLLTPPDLLSALYVKPEPARAESADARAASEFVFGNPYEGPLPEIFEYDTDLKQALADLKPSVPASNDEKDKDP